MEIKVLENIDNDFSIKWEKFVSEHPDGNFFQSPAAFNFFKSVDNHRPFIITASIENELKGILSGVIMQEPGIKGYFSRRCIIWGGPICDGNELAGLLINELNNYVKGKAIYTEFRNLFDVSNFNELFIKNNYTFEDRINYVVELISVEENRKRLNENRKRQINKSLKSGVRLLEAENTKQIEQFYEILEKLYQTKVKKPLPSLDFFQKFFKNKNLGTFLLVEYNNDIIGGIMCPIYNETIYEYYVCGLDTEFKDQSPSVMATWAAIEFGINNGLKYFDFMGAGKPDDDYGVRQFKSKFGGDEVRYGRYLKINKPILFNLGKTVLNIKQKFF